MLLLEEKVRIDELNRKIYCFPATLKRNAPFSIKISLSTYSLRSF